MSESDRYCPFSLISMTDHFAKIVMSCSWWNENRSLFPREDMKLGKSCLQSIATGNSSATLSLRHENPFSPQDLIAYIPPTRIKLESSATKMASAGKTINHREEVGIPWDQCVHNTFHGRFIKPGITSTAPNADEFAIRAASASSLITLLLI